MSYEAWRIQFQSSEQAAKSAYEQIKILESYNHSIIKLLLDLKQARPLVLYGDQWIDEIDRALSEYKKNDPDNFFDLILDGINQGKAAMGMFPQPNYVITKIAEEAGEVVQAAVHCAEGRSPVESVRLEMAQLIGMLYRLWVEGDQVHGLGPVKNNNPPHNQ